jgi:hypothetical protein
MDDRSFLTEALTFLEDRRGRFLFIGGDASDAVLDLAGAGRFMSVIGPTPEVADKLLSGLRARSLERMVTVDRRQYQDVTFEMSAFDGIVGLDLDAQAMNPKGLFKKIKHDLKMGGRFITRLRLRRDERSARALVRALRLGDQVSGRLPEGLMEEAGEGSVCREDTRQFADKYLKAVEIRYQEATPRLTRVPDPLVAPSRRLAELAARHVPGWEAACTELVLKLANEKDFGTVFMKHVRRP